MNNDLNSGWFSVAWGVLGECFVFPDMSRLLRFSRAETRSRSAWNHPNRPHGAPVPPTTTGSATIGLFFFFFFSAAAAFTVLLDVFCVGVQGVLRKLCIAPRWWLFASAVPPHGSFGSLSSPRPAGWWKNSPCDPRVGALSHISVEVEVKTRPDGSFETWTQTPEANRRVAVVTNAPSIRHHG